MRLIVILSLSFLQVSHLRADLICDQNVGSTWVTYSSSPYCYQLLTYQRGWDDAIDYCSSQEAELLVIGSETEDNFIRDQIFKYNDPQLPCTKFWVGMAPLCLDASENGQLTWIDGTTQYENKNFTANQGGKSDDTFTCVLLNKTVSSVEWLRAPCNTSAGFVCKTLKKQNDTTVASATTTPSGPSFTPTVTIRGKGFPRAGCGWNSEFAGNYTYKLFLNPETFEGALATCRAEGRDLLSITFADEISIALQLTRMFSSVDSVWIGLNKMIPAAGWRWTDGSSVAILNWYSGQPDGNNFAGTESCAEMFTNNRRSKFSFEPGTWNDQRCDFMRPFICKMTLKKSERIMGTVTTAPLDFSNQIGSCSPEWLRYENRCFKLVSDIKLNFTDAQQYCREKSSNASHNANLASVRNVYEQAYLQSLMPEGNVWIGLATHPTEPSTYLWDDESVVRYTNWGEIQENLPFVAPELDIADVNATVDDTAAYSRNSRRILNRSGKDVISCVVMDGHTSLGFWYKLSEADCANRTYNFFCSKPLIPDATPSVSSTITPVPGKIIVQRPLYSLAFYHGTPKSWSESLDVCKKSGALCSQRSCVNDLASINNRFELSLIIAHAHSLRKLGFNEFWIGLENFNVSPSCFSTSTKPHEWASFKNTSEFRWVDGWPMRISLWGSNQPNTQIGKKCVKMILNREDDYSQMLGAEWWSADCSEPHPFICKSTTERPPKWMLTGDCPSKWIESESGCFFIDSTNRNSMAEVEISQCYLNHNKSRLASFHSAEDMLTIASIHQIHTSSVRFYIGLLRHPDGTFNWLDGTPVDYVNWAPGEPESVDGVSSCVEIDNLGFWHITSCRNDRGYICYMPKAKSVRVSNDSQMISRPPSLQSAVDDSTASNLSSGQIAGIILGVLLLTGILIGLYVAHKRRLVTIPFLTRPNSGFTGNSFDNPVHVDSNDL